MKYLEDHRQNEIVTSHLVLNTKPDHKVYMSYEMYTTKAFIYTFNDIIELENSKLNWIQPGFQTHSSISFWFLGLESYINALLKVACIKKQLEFSKYKGQEIGKRLGSLLELYGINKKEFNQYGTYAKVNEFSQFRNELFHDRHFGEKVKFDKTLFSEIPFLSNQIDTFQALLIFIEVAQQLRFIIKGLDTMPSAIIKNSSYALWEKLDVCYSGILKPSLEVAFRKHQLKTNFNLEIPLITPLQSDLFAAKEVTSMLTAEQESKYFVYTNDTETNMARAIYTDFVNKYQLPPRTFRTAKTIIAE